MARHLTDKTVRDAKRKSTPYSLSGGIGAGMPGRLLCTVTPAGTKTFFFRYRTQGADRLIRIGRYGADGSAGVCTLAQASDEARKFAERLKSTPDLKQALELERRCAQEERRLKLAEAQLADRNTVRALLDEYVAHLKRAAKTSAADVQNIFDNHVLPSDLAERPARMVTAREVAQLIRTVKDAGKVRTAGKLRSYLHAAYGLAWRAEADPDASSVLVGFGIEANPVAPVLARSLASRARERTLASGELRAYMLRLVSLPPMVRDALRVALLLGGQRLTQLLRLKVGDVDFSAGTIRLFDLKGKRQQARTHVLPLTAEARAILQSILSARSDTEEAGPFVFSNDKGKRGLHVETLSVAVHHVQLAMLDSKESREPFRLGDIRRTCETMLASMGVSKDLRAQILSHGIGGVQDRHYDFHSYLPEKLRVLEAWATRLTDIAEGNPPASNVVPIGAARVA
jgi:integrase